MNAQSVNIRTILAEFKNRNPRLSSNSTHNLDNVSIHIREHTSAGGSQNRSLMPGAEQEAAVNRGQAGPELKTTRTLENSVQFEIVQGSCEDFPNKKVNFELPGGHGKVQVKLNSGKQTVSPKSVEVALSSSSGNGARATVTTKTSDEATSFISKVYLKGKVIFGDGLADFKTQSIIEVLKENRAACVDNFQRDDGGFYWLIEGVCSMKVGVMHSHNWST